MTPPTPNGLTEILATFGNPNSGGKLDKQWYRTNIVSCPLPQGMVLWYDSTKVTSIPIHYKIRDSLYSVLTKIWNYARVQVKTTHPVPPTNLTTSKAITEYYDDLTRQWLHDKHLDRYSGSFNFRLIRGSSSHLSCHAWGIAIDWDAGENPLGSHKTTLPAWWIQLWKDAGWVWGGDFKSRPDPMHVQWASGY